MSWQDDTAMLSPKEERQFWLDELTRRLPHGMAVNCRYMPSLEKTPQLLKLIEDGLVLRTREYRSKRCYRTVLRLPKEGE